MRSAALLFAALLAAPAVFPQAASSEGLGQLDASPTMFAVLAALNTAGYDDQVDSGYNSKLRQDLRTAFQGREFPSTPALRRFVRDHKKPNPVAELSQYISFALTSKGPPEFTPAQPNMPQPPDAEGLRELAPLLAAFYKEANVAALWQQAQSYIDQALDPYAAPVARAIEQANSYLRHSASGGSRARFQIFVELLGAPNQVHTRAYLDQYIVVITPSAELRVDEIRHHYLHFIADGMAFRAGQNLAKIGSLGDYALASPILEEQYKKDFNLLATECFIKAVEAKLARQPAQAERAMREGFVLTPAFYDLLPKYEAQESIMRLYFPDLVAGIDMGRESRRLDNIAFITERPQQVVPSLAPPKPPPLTGVARMLEDAEELFRAKKYDEARTAFNQVLAGAAGKPAQARAYYGLARVAVIQNDPETGDQLFRKVLEFEPDASTRSWSLLYIGKLADSQGEAEPAKEYYRQALAVTGLPDQVKREAEQGLAGAFTRARGNQ